MDGVFGNLGPVFHPLSDKCIFADGGPFGAPLVQFGRATTRQAHDKQNRCDDSQFHYAFLLCA
jgi:hypothetical protein